MLETKNFTPRLYQEKILETAKNSNTLIILPTGLGKTKTAILIALNRLNKFPTSKVLFLTPTKPLANQIYKEFKSATTINPEEIVLLTGEIKPSLRQKMWQNAKVITSTPQGCVNDILSNRIKLNDFSLLVIDEAHRTTGKYDYVKASEEYYKQAKEPRVIALTASPGSDYQKILEVCKHLKIENIEARTHDDEDVKPYIQNIEINWLKVELPEEIKKIKNSLEIYLKTRIEALKKWGLVGPSQRFVGKKQLIVLQSLIHKKLSEGEKEIRLWQGASLAAECIKLQHAIEMLETQGLSSFKNYLDNIFSEAKTTKTKAIKNIAKNLIVNKAYQQAKDLIENNIEHPKLIKVKEIIKREIDQNKNIKIIIFNQYRNSASLIEKELNKIKDIKAKLFVGQLKKGETGLTQKEQIKILNDFKEGVYNVLVATNIAEEGLDIIAVDLVIFYEPVPSAIRTIQRRGRTARQTKGRVIILITSKTADEIYHWVSYKKEKKMYNIINNLKQKLLTNN